MSYYKLPNQWKQLFVSVAAAIGYGIVFYKLNLTFPDIPEETKKFLSQYGLMIIFMAGLLAGLDYIWSEKVKYNKNLAMQEIDFLNHTIAILELQEKQLGLNFRTQLQENGRSLKNAKEKLEEATNYLGFLRFTGFMSLAFLAVGTLMCVVGAG